MIKYYCNRCEKEVKTDDDLTYVKLSGASDSGKVCDDCFNDIANHLKHWLKGHGLNIDWNFSKQESEG